MKVKSNSNNINIEEDLLIGIKNILLNKDSVPFLPPYYEIESYNMGVCDTLETVVQYLRENGVIGDENKSQCKG